MPGRALSRLRFGETVALRPSFWKAHRGFGVSEDGSEAAMAAACAVVVAVKAEGEEEEKDPGDWRDPETSRRRFWRLRSGDVSGPEEALSRRRELCRRWLRPERRSKERMLELLVLEQILSLLPRRLREPVRRRRPESGEETAAWARALHPASPQGTPTFKAKAGSLTRGEWSSCPWPGTALVERVQRTARLDLEI
ncbi:zinc finger protein 394-like [Meriones unguiculatus]|uniref:zinc finger protein 394-like n=1 Tax=Meriones unguiculatus TaxID=10047 RepID=UPI000B4F49D2|nr:zinc finger protein 394-like [Meriones unguiculatus]XP_021515740.1 zinc finger protein 394-like [Meriones unguiculatus]XP_021515741.1 zinc finger protein 394-like [Meriones unguiculatus]XP_021515742.1 zinc finger protein 394-like [Meriones unguiculatus]XP_021515743.1 zinc finger protein 394-like [Meriones unguiculatus]XP_060232132.1 zinc finger protein 394-like [Meriones unguiculatus]XP_060232133.1 zinc finger protein 394-like [Meriones unguiculatus]XP_060232134.1 zinc finger protein 394-